MFLFCSVDLLPYFSCSSSRALSMDSLSYSISLLLLHRQIQTIISTIKKIMMQAMMPKTIPFITSFSISALRLSGSCGFGSGPGGLGPGGLGPGGSGEGGSGIG